MKYKKIKEFLLDTRYLWRRYILTSCVSLLMILSGLLLPILMQKIIDQGIYGESIKLLLIYIVIYFVLAIIQTGAMHIVNVQYAIIGKQYSVETKKKVFNTIKKFYGSDAQEEKSGKIVHMIEEDIDDISLTITDKIFQIVNDIFTAMFSFVMLLYISPSILIIVLVLQILLIFINRYLSDKINNLNREYFYLRDIQGSSLQECMLNLEYLIGSNLIDYFSKKYIKKEEQLTDISYDINKTMSMNFCSQNILNTITKCIIWGVGGVLVILKKITIGKLYVVEIYAGKLAAPIYRIVDSNLEIKKSIVEIERVYSLINRKFDEEKNRKISLKDKVISFRDVQFSYDSKNLIFKDLNVKIYPNQVNVFIGKSGQGKTTIIKLLTRMWNVNKGKILIDNIDMYEYSKTELRNQIGIVSQEIPIFNATIMENLLLSNKISMDEIIYACQRTGIYNEIMSKKEQFNMIISEYGRNLSGGQRQRIAITRAILKRAEVIILDEPTANLDPESREQIKKLIYGLKDKTIILITHDRELIKPAKNIYLLEDGEVRNLE